MDSDCEENFEFDDNEWQDDDLVTPATTNQDDDNDDEAHGVLTQVKTDQSHGTSAAGGDRKSVGFGADYPFKVLSPEDVGEYMDNSVQEAANVLQLPHTVIKILLRHFGWDQDKLLESYYSDNSEDQKIFFEKVSIISPHISIKRNMNNDGQINEEEEQTCQICFTPRRTSAMHGIQCGHPFCSECWRTYLRTKILEQGQQKISCPAHNCPIIVDDDMIHSLLADDPKVGVRFDELIINNFVQSNRLLRWCPGVDCSKAIRVNFMDWRRPVICSCGQKFCFECGQNVHFPVQCDWLSKWLSKCEDDSETCNWIVANTKDCPQCKVAIEKNGGCNHMVCKTCITEFCWVCMGPWKHHMSMRGYNCNRYNEPETKAVRDAAEKSRARLTRYLFYYNRYSNHNQSLKFENKLYTSVQSMMKQFQEEQNMTWIDVQFLNKAVDILCQCRQMLMYTYAFAFFLAKTNQSVIFEDNQRDLEGATEKLSEYLERDLNDEEGQRMNAMDIKEKVQNLCHYCQSRRQVVLEHVYEGYEKEWWMENE